MSVFFHRGDSSPHFVEKLADAARAASAEGGVAKVEGLEVEEVAFTRIARAVLMQTEMPLEIESHLWHEDKSPQPKATYRGRDGYEQKDGAVANYRAYYYYRGSRTQPPCEQTFGWVLLKHSLPVSDRDLQALTSLTGPNARALQVRKEAPPACLMPRAACRLPPPASSCLLLTRCMLPRAAAASTC